ncbi:MAG: hypothetical protein U9N34_03300 [Candidatus Cloacimonadota bacterium]|nr:hypothetical protein [Candidatus Cloacimonadota bacterium]
MKKHIVVLIGLATFFFSFISCGNQPSGNQNQYLGEIPSIEKQYYSKIEEKEESLKKCTDLKKAYKLDKEMKLLEEERKTKIKEYVSANPFTKPLPFKGLSGTAYTINDVTIRKASAGNLNLKFSATINEDMKNKYGGFEKYLFIYFKGVDSKGKTIEKSITVATNFKTEPLKAGLEYEAFGSWQTKALIHMEDFAKIVEITREEYDKKHY